MILGKHVMETLVKDPQWSGGAFIRVSLKNELRFVSYRAVIQAQEEYSSLIWWIDLRDKSGSEFSFSLLFYIEISNDGKNNGSHHVHKQILHRVMKAN